MKHAHVVALALACVMGAAAVAVDAGETNESKVTLSWEQFKAITRWDERAVRTGDVVIPWAEAQKLLGVDVAGVDGATIQLPWTQFRALVEWSIEHRKDEDKAPPPTNYVVTRAVYSGTLGKGVATFDAELDVDVLRKKGWKRIPVLPATVGVDKAELPKDKEAYLNVAGSMYEVLTQAEGKLPVKLRFATSVTEDGGLNVVSFDRVSSGTCLLELAVESQDVEVKVAGAQDITPQGAPKRLFALPAGNRVAITWERKIEEVKKGPPKLYAQTETLVAVGDGLVTCRQKVFYSIVHAGVREVQLAVPEGVNVLDVSGSYLHDWRVEGGALKVQFAREVKGSHRLDVTFEKAAAGTLDAPVLTTAGTERERGFVAIVALANVEVAGVPKGDASAVDASALPPELVGLTGQPVLLGYRYTGKAFSVPLEIRKHADVRVLVTLVDAAAVTATQTLDGRRITRMVYDVRNNRNQFLRVTMPKDAEIWSLSVSGKAAQPARDEQGKTLIPLVRSSGQHLAAFPVEIVYVQKGEKPSAEGKGAIRVDLPRCDQPIMHVLCSLYLPEQGRYESFSGPLKHVEQFSDLQERTMPGGRPQVVSAQDEARQLEQAVNQGLRQAAPAGVTPIQVSLPTSGKLLRFQKVLVLEGDELWVELKYSRWPGYRSGWW